MLTSSAQCALHLFFGTWRRAPLHDTSVMLVAVVQASVEAAVSSMHERGLDHTSAGVYFGQLLGMADPLTYVLGAHGYRVNSCLLLKEKRRDGKLHLFQPPSAVKEDGVEVVVSSDAI